MVSSSGGASSGSSQIAVYGSSAAPEEVAALMRQRKQKRMLSNRESARRSRMRKQKHLDELAAQAAELRKENGQIIAAINITSQNFAGVESENSVLRAQVMELSSRLQALNEIIYFVQGSNGSSSIAGGSSSSNGGGMVMIPDGSSSPEGLTMRQPWSLMMAMNQSIMASPDHMFQYC